MTTLEKLKLFEQLSNEEMEEREKFSEVYHSQEVFHLNYAEMERKCKVYIYPDGNPRTYYQTPWKLTGKYASEGYFFQNIRKSIFRTNDPEEAHLFFIPISCHKMREKKGTVLIQEEAKLVS